MTEERYIKITSCKDCKYNGHSCNVITNTFTHICGNPDTMELDIPKETIGRVNYPITSQTARISDSPIPAWCKLPTKSEVYYCGE